MDNLFRLAWGNSISSLFMSTVILLVAVYRLIKLRQNGDRKKKRETPLMALIAILVFLVFTPSLKSAYLDYKAMDIQSVSGTVQQEERIRKKRSGTRYEYTILTEEGEEVKVYVSGGKTKEHPLEKGEEYTVEYFPRTKAVYSITPID